MKQIFIIGASFAYGVGAEHLGWADQIKHSVSHTIYGANGSGENIEVYNLAKPGAFLTDVLESLDILSYYKIDSADIDLFINIGGNDSKAINKPDNYVADVAEYKENLQKLIFRLLPIANNTFFLGNAYIDESKTSPKTNPRDGSKSYFSRVRWLEFNKATSDVCKQNGVAYLDVKVPEEDWLMNYLYKDGLHPNQKGHEVYGKLIQEHMQ